MAIHLRIGSAEFRYVGEYRPGKHGPVAVMGNGGLPAIIFSDPYIMVIIPFAAMQSHATTRYSDIKRLLVGGEGAKPGENLYNYV